MVRKTIILLLFVTKVAIALPMLEVEESYKNNNQDKLLTKTKDALLSFDHVEERADYFVFKLKNLTFGEYSENVMYLAPVLSGNVEFQAQNFNFYYNHFQDKGGVKYSLSF